MRLDTAHPFPTQLVPMPRKIKNPNGHSADSLMSKKATSCFQRKAMWTRTSVDTQSHSTQQKHARDNYSPNTRAECGGHRPPPRHSSWCNMLRRNEQTCHVNAIWRRVCSWFWSATGTAPSPRCTLEGDKPGSHAASFRCANKPDGDNNAPTRDPSALLIRSGGRLCFDWRLWTRWLDPRWA